MFFHIYKKNIITNMHKNIKLQMFSIATFFAIIGPTRKEYLTQIIKNKNLPFVKTKNRNVLNVQIKNSWTQLAHEK